MSRSVLKRICVLALVASPTFVSAATLGEDTIAVSRDIAYDSDQVGSALVRETCDWKNIFFDALTRYSKGRVLTTDVDLRSINGKTLTVVITSVHAAGGGGYSGPKWLHARVSVLERNVLIATRSFTTNTNVGGFTACSSLQKLGKKLGANIGKWSRTDFQSAQSEAESEQASDEAEEDKGA